MIIPYTERLKTISSPQKINQYYKIYHYPCAESCIDFISRFCMTYDPRTKEKVKPFELFKRQEEFILWLWARYKNRESGVVDKCRDVGATWCFCAFSLWLVLFQKDVSVGIFTYKASENDYRGDNSTIFEKIRFMIKRLPPLFVGEYKDNLMYLKFYKTDSDISGASGDNPGRGGRRTLFIKDESAFYQHADMIEASLSETSDCIIDVSTHAGANTLFYQKSVSNSLPVFTFDWWENPNHSQDWYEDKKMKAESQGLMHIFNREIERNPLASIDSVIIPSNWIMKSKKCEEIKHGKIIFSLDVADEGNDTNSLTGRNGNSLIFVDEWGGAGSDPTETAEKAFWKAIEFGAEEFRYDNIGVGSGIRGPIRKIKEKIKKDTENAKLKLQELKLDKSTKNAKEILALEKKIKHYKKILDIKIIGWNAGGKVVRPFDSDFNDKPNQELFENAKAQAVYQLREIFRNTSRYVDGEKHDPSKIICLQEISNHPKFTKMINEISQYQQKFSVSGRVQVEKKPKQSKSPNIGDSIVMLFADVEAEFLPWAIV